MDITIIGGGLAGSEAALQLACRGLRVRLVEMRPVISTAAHKTDRFGELVCSNSFKSDLPGTAPFLLKEELRRLGSHLIRIADEVKIPAGHALAVDREAFARRLTEEIGKENNIEVVRQEARELPTGGINIIATGPLTSSALSESIARFAGSQHLYFYDAISPIVDATTLDMSRLFSASRYGKGGEDYLNAPMSQEEYLRFYKALAAAESVALHGFEKALYFEGCLPIEELARRGVDTLRFGPMKPVGLIDPRTGRRPYAAVQLRLENRMADSYNLVGFQNHLMFPEQKRVFRLIPGLENAEFLRFGQIHRNTYIRSPELLLPTLQARSRPSMLFAGQICGVEGYVESIATGCLAGINAGRLARGLKPDSPPRSTACGSLVHYIAFADPRHFQPANINFGLLPEASPELKKRIRDRKERHNFQVKEALAAMGQWVDKIESAQAGIRPGLRAGGRRDEKRQINSMEAFSSSSEKGEIRQSVCPLDCPDRCSLEVSVRDGEVTAIRGSRVHSLTSGFICAKVSRFARRLHGPDRVLYPLRRTGSKGSGEFARFSWEEAIAEISHQLRNICDESGPEAILPFAYGGSNGLLTHDFVDAHFFRRLGASRTARTLCAASTTLALDALYGKMPGTAFEDYPEARFILIWGANPAHSNIHLVPFLKEARRRGARIALVDPRRMLGNELVDIHLQPYPGTDVAVALAMIHHLDRQGMVDRTFLANHATGWEELLGYARNFPLDKVAGLARVEAGEIARLAEAYAQAEPAVLRCGWGLERNRNGLAAVAAALALPAVAGKFGRVGGGFSLSSSKAYKVDDETLAGWREVPTRSVNQCQLGQALTEGGVSSIRALLVYNCNPAATVPNHNLVLEGLRRQDLFTVVLDQVMTDTASFADIVLPATTFLEHRELNKSYGSYALQLAEPVIAGMGEAKPNAEVFQLLGRAMGWSDGLFAKDEAGMLEQALDAVRGPFDSVLTAGMLQEKRIAYFDFPGRHPVQFSTVFPGTPDGKIHLQPSCLGAEPFRYIEEFPDSRFPLALVSPASNKSISSTLAEFNLLEIKVEMHPGDAGERGLREGDQVRIFNLLGEVHCGLKLDLRLKPGVVSLAKGIWRRATLNGSVGNALVPDTVTPVSGGACYNDARVQVERL